MNILGTTTFRRCTFTVKTVKGGFTSNAKVVRS